MQSGSLVLRSQIHQLQSIATFGSSDHGVFSGNWNWRSSRGRNSPLQSTECWVSMHMATQTDVLVESLQILGASMRWASSNIFVTQDHVAAVIAKAGTVFTWKEETLPEYRWCTERRDPLETQGDGTVSDPELHEPIVHTRLAAGQGFISLEAAKLAQISYRCRVSVRRPPQASSSRERWLPKMSWSSPSSS